MVECAQEQTLLVCSLQSKSLEERIVVYSLAEFHFEVICAFFEHKVHKGANQNSRTELED